MAVNRIVFPVRPDERHTKYFVSLKYIARLSGLWETRLVKPLEGTVSQLNFDHCLRLVLRFDFHSESPNRPSGIGKTRETIEIVADEP